MKRKLTAIFLALCMLASLLPGTVFAEDTRAYNQFRVGYDMGGGSVYWSRGTNLPEGTEEDFLADGDRTTNINTSNTVHFLIDPTRAVDRDAWDGGDFITYTPWQASDRSINVRVNYPTADSWYSANVVVNSQAVETGYTFENNVLSFKAEAAVGEVSVDIWWTDHDFAYYNFEPEDGEILIDYQWNDGGEVVLDPNTTILRSCPQPEQKRARITVPDTTQSVTFTWTGHVNRIWVESLADENGWGAVPGAALSSYTYALDQVNEFNDPWNHYGINFDFFWDWSCQLRVSYDAGGGTVYGAVGSTLPAETAADYLYDGAWISFEENGVIQPVHLRLDQAHESWIEGDGTFVQRESNVDPADRDLYVFASYTAANGEPRWEWVVEAGEAVLPGYTLENNVLSFTPETGCEMNLDVYWTEDDYNYSNLGWDDDTVLIEFNCWGDGTVHWPEGVDLGSMVQPERCRGKVLVPLGTESVTFTWDGHLRTFQVFGLNGEWGPEEWREPAFDSYTLVLDQTEDDGSPRHHYQMNFDFADLEHEYNFLFAANYDDNGGAVFYGVNETPAATAPYYLPRQGNFSEDWPDNISFNDDGEPAEIRLLFDPTRSLDFEAWNEGEVSFRETWTSDDRAISVVAKYPGLDGTWHEDVLVLYGEANGPEATFANNLLTWTPESGYGVDFDIYWTREDYDFSQFHGTEDKPVLVEVEWWGAGQPYVQDEVPLEDMLVSDGRMRIRLPWETESLTFFWSEDAVINWINVEGIVDEENNWVNFVPEENVFTLNLDQTWDNGEPRDNYRIWFDFEGWAVPNDGLLRFGYDQNRGSVFCALGDEIPVESEACYRHNGEEGNMSFLVNGEPQTVRLRFSEGAAIDWDLWWNEGVFELRPADEVEDRSLFIAVRSNQMEGLVVADGVLTDYGQANGFFYGYVLEAYSDLLVFTPTTESDIEISVYWSREDYEFNTFQPTEEKPVIVEANWWGEGAALLDDYIPDEDVVVGNGRMKIRLPLDRDSLVFTWGEDDLLRQINVEGLGEDGGWLNGIIPDGDVYVLYLDQFWGPDDPRTYYHIQFEFEGPSMPSNGMIRVYYDQNGGSVFRELGYYNYPEATADCYQFEGDYGAFCYLDEDGLAQDVNLLIDETRAFDWTLWDEEGEIGFVEPNHYDERNLIVYVRSNRLDGVVVWDGNMTEYAEYKGFRFSAEHVLSFGGVDGTSDLEIKIYWTEADYEFDQFHGTEDAPVCVQVDWWGNGSVNLPAGIDPGDMFVQDNRARIRVPWGTESLTFTWDENDPLRQINVNGYQGYQDWFNDVPFEGNSYTLNLNATWDNGDPKDWYHIQFEFEDGGWNQEGMMISFYDQAKGTIFWALGEDELATDAAHCLGFGFESAVPYLAEGQIQPVRLFFDEEHAAAYDENGSFLGFEPSMELADRAVTVWAESVNYNGKIVDNGVLTELGQAHGYSFANNILSFTPENGVYVLFHVDWCEADAEFDDFQPTEEFPVIVEYNYYNYGEIIPPAGIAPENILLQPGRTRMRVAADTEELTFTWAENYGVRRVSWSDVNYEDDWHDFFVDQSEPHSFTLYLDNEADHGVNHYYILDFEFFPDSRYQLWVSWCGSEGNVYYGLNEVPAIDIANYIFENPSYLVVDDQGNESIGTVYLRLDHEHSVSYFDEDPTELYDLGDWEGYDPSVIVSYPHDDGTWFDGFAVRHGQAVAPGFTFENDVLSFTPENEQPVQIFVFWSDDDMNYQNFEGTEDKPIIVELMLGGRAPVELPEVPAEDMLIWHAAEHDYVKLRVSEDCESLTFHWAREGVIGYVEVDGAGEDGQTLILYPPKGTSYTLTLDQMDWGGPRGWYYLSFWAYGWPENPFVDVPEDAWYREAVILMQITGVTAGTTPTTFSPDLPATRAQVITFLWRAYGSQTPESMDCPFTDVAEDAWYRDAVLWAVENSITGGTSDTTFSPNQVCKRNQVITFLWRAAGSPEPESDDCPFTDVPRNAWYRDAVLWALENGRTAGTSETTFSPKKDCTRAEIAMFLYRVLMYVD